MRKYGFSFSWKRAIGLSSAKSKLSREIGIPLTRSGRQRKVGRMLGCLLPTLMLLTVLVLLVLALFVIVNAKTVQTSTEILPDGGLTDRR